MDRIVHDNASFVPGGKGVQISRGGWGEGREGGRGGERIGAQPTSHRFVSLERRGAYQDDNPLPPHLSSF